MNRCLEALFPHSALSGLYCSSSLDVSSLQSLLEPMMPQETTLEEEKPRQDDKTQTANQEKEPGSFVLNEESLPQDEPQEEVVEKSIDIEQEQLDLT